MSSTHHLWQHPHHDGSPLYLDDQSPAMGDVARARVFVPHGPGGSGAEVQVAARRVRDGEPAWTRGEVESTDDVGAWWAVDVPVDQPVTTYRFLLGTGGADGGYRWLNAAGVHRRDVTDAGDFRLVAHPPPPAWVTDQVAYQVFPDRFARSGQDRPTPPWGYAAGWDDPVVHTGPDTPRQWFGGDLDGVAARLDHLQRLGATALYLTPVFEARSNHRYDAVSFDRVDPVLGGDEALARLIGAAHARGVRVVGDLTLNHTGDAHEWFTRAQGDRTTPEAGFYTFGATPDEYVSWLDIPSLPKLDHSSPELRRRLYEGEDSVVARWLREGLDGWRIDVANMTGRLGAVDLAHEVARAVRRTFARFDEPRWLLAEHGHDASADLAGDGWHGTMDYAGFTRPVWAWLNGGSAAGPGLPHGLAFLGLPLAIPVLGGAAAVATMREVHAAMPWRSQNASTLHLDSHDTPRFRTVTGGGTDGGVDLAGRGRDLHLLGLALQMTLPGVPTVFQGDEIGLTGTDGEHSRTPFPWERPESWDQQTLAAYARWIGLRNASVALRRGGLRWVHADEDSMTFLREHPHQRVLVHVVRRSGTALRLPLRALGLSHADRLETLAGEPATPAGTDAVLLPGDGPGAHAYALH